MSNGNYIKLHRSLMEWEWYKDSNTSRLFIHLLLRAHWVDMKYRGSVIPRGSFTSTLQELATETNMTISQIRTAIKHLKMTNEIATESHSEYTKFTVVNYNAYQENNKQDDKPIANQSQTDDKPIAHIKEYKEIKKERINKYTCAFDEFWKVYPRKKDKGNAFKKFNARLNNGFSEDELIGAAKNYAAECLKNQTEEKYIKHPATFLSDSLPFQEYLEKEKPKVEEVVPEEDESIIDLWSEE